MSPALRDYGTSRPDVLDDRDQAALDAAQAALDARPGIRAGDWIEFADGNTGRVAHVWEWGEGPELVQPTDGGSFHSFHLSTPAGGVGIGAHGGFASFSGGLRPGVKPDTLTDTGERRPGAVWIWHHGRACAHNGVTTTAVFRVFRCTEGRP